MEKRNLINKKGQGIPNVFMILIGLGLGLIVFTIVMSIGGDVLTSLQSSTVSTQTTQVGNQTNTSRTLNSFALATDVEDGLVGTPIVYNETNATNDIIPSTNYSFSTSGGTATLSWTSPEYNDTKVNVTFDYTDRIEDVAYNTTGFGLTGVLNIAEFNPTFGTIIVLSGILLLLGAVIGSIVLFRRT